jgi:rhodanese-related sulfurtransferase
MKFREFNLRRDPECPVCGDAPSIFAPIDYEEFCAGPPAADWFAAPEGVPTISVNELKIKMENKEALTLIDVREPYEYEIARIDGARLIPLGELESHVGELPRTGTLVCQCHSGGRSEHAARLLQEAGFENVYNLGRNRRVVGRNRSSRAEILEHVGQAFREEPCDGFAARTRARLRKLRPHDHAPQRADHQGRRKQNRGRQFSARDHALRKRAG